ncbi:MAG: hypothetical protein JSS83_05695 [Cyanobacteria bacterium SZAS LIN-3]|nr:hypothetical protein [Cyanobacteria bacterium SZAS LIN-3]
MKLLTPKRTINLTAFLAAALISQSLAAELYDGAAGCGAFAFGKKKAEEEAAKSESAKDEPKEKVKGKSKQEVEEEEALEAEYTAYQKELAATLKSVKNPFGSNDNKTGADSEGDSNTLTIAGASPRAARLSLGQRLLQCKLYMPGRMMIGHPAEFTIKGRPGYWAALAMADRDKGAKPIYGRELRLGPDRKVVAIGKIPESGVLQLKIFTPIAGDLIGGNLYFEAAVWPENRLEQMELAMPVSSESQAASQANSVAIIGEGERKRGLKFIPDSRSPYARANGPGLGSGSP